MAKGWAFASIVVAALSIAITAGWFLIVRESGIDPLPSDWPPTPKMEGVFTSNKILQGLEKIGVGKLPGPEDIAVDAEGRLYTGCADGWIKRIFPESGHVENWVHVGGHPLGVMIGVHGELIVCEPLLGLLNVTEEKVEVLSNQADGVKFKLTDGVDVAKNGIIYFTDATFKFGMHESDRDVLECRPNGRLMKYDPVTRETTVLMKDLRFANGVALSAKQDFLVVCETAMVRCLRYWLEGPKKDTAEPFIENLPGYPDNIRHNGDDRFWIGLISRRERLTDWLFKKPFLKHILALPGVLEKFALATKMSKVLAVTEDGEAVEFYEDPEGKAIAFVTTALEVGDYLYLGGLASNYIGKVHLQSRKA